MRKSLIFRTRKMIQDEKPELSILYSGENVYFGPSKTFVISRNRPCKLFGLVRTFENSALCKSGPFKIRPFEIWPFI